MDKDNRRGVTVVEPNEYVNTYLPKSIFFTKWSEHIPVLLMLGRNVTIIPDMTRFYRQTVFMKEIRKHQQTARNGIDI